MSETTQNLEGLPHECRFAVYCPPPEGERDDFHLIKEVVHMPDGTTKPNVRIVRNEKRPFWITKKGRTFRNHKDKKEWERIDNLRKFECTQSELYASIAIALEEPWRLKDKFHNLRKLFQNPYVYGADILSTAVIKRRYMDKWPDLNTQYTVAPFDVETDVVNGTNQITIATLSFGKKVVTAVQRSFLEGQADSYNRLHQKLQDLLSAVDGKDKEGNPIKIDFIGKRKFNWELLIVDDEISIVKEIFKRAHEWQPDFVAIWNLEFDMQKLLDACQRAGVEPKNIFSDPRVPRAWRHFEFKKAQAQKVTASGKIMPKRPEERWHTVFCPASFYFIDAMAAYNYVRAGQQKETSYSLDNMLDKHLKVRKLKFKEADKFVKLEWHQFMQANYPLEYVIYNVFDCVSMEELDESTKDLRMTLPLFSKCSDFQHFNSQPRRLVDDLHYFCLKNDLVIATTSNEMEEEFDEETIGLEGWITTLPAHMVADNGLCLIEEDPTLRTNIRGHVGDLDVSASYPNGGAVFNISKETTKRELIEIMGITERQQRVQGINLSAGATNAVEFCTELFSMPQMDTLLKAFERTIEMEQQKQAA